MAKQGDYYDELLGRLTQRQSDLRALEEAARKGEAGPYASQKLYAIRREIAELMDEKYRTERGLLRRDIDLTSDDRPARRAKAKPSTGKTEVKPRTTGKVEAGPTGKVEARTGKMEAPTGKVEARTGKVEARPRATGKMEAPTGKVEAKAARGVSRLGRAGKVVKGALRTAGKVAGPLGVLDSLYMMSQVEPPEPVDMQAAYKRAHEMKQKRAADKQATTQPLVEKAMKYYPTALAQAAATAGHGSYQEIQRRYQPMMSNIMEDVRSRVTPMMSDDEVRGMLQRGVDDFVGRLDGLKPAGGVYRPGVGGPVPGSGMR